MADIIHYGGYLAIKKRTVPVLHLHYLWAFYTELWICLHSGV